MFLNYCQQRILRVRIAQDSKNTGMILPIYDQYTQISLVRGLRAAYSQPVGKIVYFQSYNGQFLEL